ncbi:Kelch domain-containing protein 10 [Halotydeus destructor]|nr:Kelch domain-containing protein 10 [Halotydeus destructor]
MPLPQRRSKMFKMKPFRFMQIRPEGNANGDGILVRIPKARSGHRIVVDENGDIYSFGGYNPHVSSDDEDLVDPDEWHATKPLFRELWKFNMTLKKWIKLRTTGEAPRQLASHCALIVNRHLIVYGGTGVPFGQSSSNLIYKCNLDSLLWERLKPDPKLEQSEPTEQYGQAIAVDDVDGCLYVVGGTTGYRYTIDVHKFSFRSRQWTELYRKVWGSSVFPEERYRHEIVLYKKKLFIFGGGTAESCHTFKDLAVFDTENRTWESVQTKADAVSQEYPSHRRCHGCVHVGSDVFIVGGTDGSEICNDLWKIDLNALQWVDTTVKMPLPVYFHGSAVSNSGQMVIFGGVNSTPHNERNNDLYSIWLNKPPLKELAWQALVHYSDSKSLLKTPVEDLVLMGIPNKYIQRLFGLKNLRPAQPY